MITLLIVIGVIWALISPFASAWLAVRLCSAHWQCPMATRRQAEEWTAKLERERVVT
jgi:uncharacterized membrane protein (DUF485 family)